jgi:hypothetical protein
MAITSDHIFDRCADGNDQWPHIWQVFWWQWPVTTYLTDVLICGHWWLPSEHLSNMWSLVITIRTPVKYVVTGDCHQNTCQICGHWWLPSEHLSNMWSLVSHHIFHRCSEGNHQWPHIWQVFWRQSPVTTYLTGVLMAMTSDHIRTPVKYVVTGDCLQNTCQICGHWWLPSEHLSNMWSLVIAIRTPVKYVVTGDYHQNICQICGHWWLPSEHLSNMWSMVIAIRTPV